MISWSRLESRSPKSRKTWAEPRMRCDNALIASGTGGAGRPMRELTDRHRRAEFDKLLADLASDERQRVARRVKQYELDRHLRREVDFPERNGRIDR